MMMLLMEFQTSWGNGASTRGAFCTFKLVGFCLKNMFGKYFTNILIFIM